MELITLVALVHASRDVSGMSHAQKILLADEIFERQPNLLASVLVLPNMGVSTLELEVPLHVLLVTFQAMKRSGHIWPTIQEDVQEKCLMRLTARMRFNEGLTAEIADGLVKQFCDEHSERHLLAFAYGYLKDHDLLYVRTEAEKFLLLAVLNLVECIAFVGAQASPG
jgi:hypothetical protein